MNELEQLKRLKVVADAHGYGLDYLPPDGEGGGDEFQLWSNIHAPGVTGVYRTLAEVGYDVADVAAGGRPL
jgi:hypothetical protein